MSKDFVEYWFTLTRFTPSLKPVQHNLTSKVDEQYIIIVLYDLVYLSIIPDCTVFSSILPKLEIMEETVIAADTSRTSETTANSDLRLQIKKKKEIKSQKTILTYQGSQIQKSRLIKFKKPYFPYITK